MELEIQSMFEHFRRAGRLLKQGRRLPPEEYEEDGVLYLPNERAAKAHAEHPKDYRFWPLPSDVFCSPLEECCSYCFAHWDNTWPRFIDVEYVTDPVLAKPPRKKDLIHALPSKVLIDIFKLLRPRERIRCERVCRRWREVAKAAWTGQSILDCTMYMKMGQNCIERHQVLLSVLRRAKHLHHLEVIDVSHGVEFFKQLRLMDCQFGKLETLRIVQVDLPCAALRVLGRFFENITALEFHDCRLGGFPDGERGLEMVLSHMHQLEFLSIYSEDGLLGTCFSELPTTVKSLALGYCLGLIPMGVEYIRQRVGRNLQELRLVEVSDAAFGLFKEELPELRYVCLELNDTFKSYSGMPQLVRFEQRDNMKISAASLEVLLRHSPHIEELGIREWYDEKTLGDSFDLLGNFALKAIRLPNTTELQDRHLDAISAHGLLQSMLIYDCHAVSSEAIARAIQRCPALDRIDFHYDDGLDVALEAALAARQAKEGANARKVWFHTDGHARDMLRHVQSPLLKVRVRYPIPLIQII